MKRTRTCFIALIVIAFSLFFAGHSRSAEDGKGGDLSGQASRELFIGQAVKLFAKGYIAISDIDKAKKNNIAKLEKMNDQEFAHKYAALYGDMSGLPQGVKDAYGIDEKMDRTGAINKIRSAGKKDLYTIIDSIPDPFITRHFDSYLAGKGIDPKKRPSPMDAMVFWDSVRKKLDGE
jgi:hypothetical protein